MSPTTFAGLRGANKGTTGGSVIFDLPPACLEEEAAIGVRFFLKEKAAIDRYAKIEKRPTSVMLRKIVVDHLREKGC